MCGICGIINFSYPDFSTPRALEKMSNLIAHRGPDDEGFALFNDQEKQSYSGNATPEKVRESDLNYIPKKHISEADKNYTVGLAHRRLSILDLSPSGHQPMSSEDSNLWITYNGEIYNYLEIKQELTKKGHRFFSNSDTEVILKAYQEWGVDCVERFNGMWAFVVYDRRKSLIWCSRDRVGVKPFYYFQNEKFFLFASEQKSILHSGLIEKKINYQAAFDYLSFNEIENRPQGLLQGIIELEPAHHLFIDLKSGIKSLTKYYSLPVNNSPERIDPKKTIQYQEEILEKLKQSVQLRLRADVEVGSCLSGGMDSSSIVGLMHHLQPENKIHLFTSTNLDATIDESKWAKMMVDYSKGQWHTVQPSSKELLGDLEELTLCQDIPLFSTSTYAQWRVMQKVKEAGITVVLDGQGGDELFAGYEPHRYFLNYENNKNYLGKQWMKYHGLQRFPASILKKIYRSKFPDFKMIDEDLYDTYSTLTFDDFKNQQQFTLNDRLAHEFYNSSLKSYLKCEDRCSMWFSVESRVPLADDKELNELLFSIPGNYKIENNTLKSLLKEAIKGHIPEDVRLRKDKLGYTTPNNQWICEIKNEVRDYFSADLSEFIDLDYLHKNYDTFFDQQQSPENRRIFKFISFAVWKKVNDL
ncbi:MAG: asparagine synthase (glutamine-hydrolyzing) [Bacteroidetes bacterium]|nr:asparagine synthase (glutamine-hydrolyzing) [Bacteroidota bacterium]